MLYVMPAPSAVPERCRLTIALATAAQVTKNSAEINVEVKVSRPTAAMGAVRRVRTTGAKKHKAVNNAMLNPMQ
jgi:hypothetical protein